MTLILILSFALAGPTVAPPAAKAPAPKNVPAAPTPAPDIPNVEFPAFKKKADEDMQNPEGKNYLPQASASLKPRLLDAGRSCTKKKGLRIDGVFVVDEAGRLRSWTPRLTSPDTECIGNKLVNTQIFAPPAEGFYLYVDFFAN